jgi:hypothetical protein
MYFDRRLPVDIRWTQVRPWVLIASAILAAVGWAVLFVWIPVGMNSYRSPQWGVLLGLVLVVGFGTLADVLLLTLKSPGGRIVGAAGLIVIIAALGLQVTQYVPALYELTGSSFLIVALVVAPLTQVAATAVAIVVGGKALRDSAIAGEDIGTGVSPP